MPVKLDKHDIDMREIDEISWFIENSSGVTPEIGSKKPNIGGCTICYEIMGMCWDLYDESTYGPIVYFAV